MATDVGKVCSVCWGNILVERKNNDMVASRKFGCRIVTRLNEQLTLEMRKLIPPEILNIPVYYVFTIDFK
jgi:hypothetical protein